MTKRNDDLNDTPKARILAAMKKRVARQQTEAENRLVTETLESELEDAAGRAISEIALPVLAEFLTECKSQGVYGGRLRQALSWAERQVYGPSLSLMDEGRSRELLVRTTDGGGVAIQLSFNSRSETLFEVLPHELASELVWSALEQYQRGD